MMKIFLSLVIYSFNVYANESNLKRIQLPQGFKISIYAKNIEGARSMAWGKNGILFVGSKGTGKVYAVAPDRKVQILVENLNQPNGVAYKDGNLYIAEIHRLLKFENVDSSLNKLPVPKVIAEFPKDSHHGWKFIAFGPDGKLYIPQGAPCNICELKDPYGTITSMDSDGKNQKIVARGIRNTVGFDWHPSTQELWFTDNGRDHLGDDLPADELNRLSKEGQHFGYPYCHAGDILDPEFGKSKNCSDYQAPEKKLGAHVAALGMRFYTGKSFPKKYQQQIFIAEHGSWNRSQKIGYRITLVTLDEKGRAKDYEVFAQGWLSADKVWGRPVDVINTPDGSLLVSDDEAGSIYKIEFKK